MSATPREDVRAAFKTVLDATFGPGGTAAAMGVIVYDRLPFEGADIRSVVLTMISGTSKSSGVGMYGGPETNPISRSVMSQYRLQVDCNYDDKEGCANLADAVEQAIWDAHDDLRENHDIHHIQKILDIDTLPLGASVRVPVLTREARVIMDFTFWTHRRVTA